MGALTCQVCGNQNDSKKFFLFKVWKVSVDK